VQKTRARESECAREHASKRRRVGEKERARGWVSEKSKSVSKRETWGVKLSVKREGSPAIGGSYESFGDVRNDPIGSDSKIGMAVAAAWFGMCMARSVSCASCASCASSQALSSTRTCCRLSSWISVE